MENNEQFEVSENITILSNDRCFPKQIIPSPDKIRKLDLLELHAIYPKCYEKRCKAGSNFKIIVSAFEDMLAHI